MDYKEKYLKGLEEAKKTLDSLDENYRCHELTKDDIRGIYSRLFPELAESDEEKIRKALIFAVRDWDYVNGIESKKVIAYLESLKEAQDISANFEKAEKEKTEFVSGKFIKCVKPFSDFNAGEHYWLEYIGDDEYNGRSDNILGVTYHITPGMLYTCFIQDDGVSESAMIGKVWKIIPLFKVGDFIKKKGKDYVPWKITEVNEEGGYYCGNYQHGYPTELMFRDQRDYERVDNPGMGVPKINGKPVSTENNVVNISHWVPSDDQLEAIRFLMEDYKPWLLSASEARKELGAIYDEMLKLAKK